jgi:indolepyruvate ferredoxin oxidoreductase beta subunit
VNTQRTINMVAAALGGEGGGVFTNWLIDVADEEGWLCQSTSLAGVAQRTGATIYYLEFFPRSDAVESLPVMSLFPSQGDIDIAVASEISEAGRMVQRGFVTPDRTALLTSTHRIYAIDEKIALANGIIDASAVQSIAGKYAKRTLQYDMQKLASEHNAIISAVLLGAVAGADVLPFSKATYERVIHRTGKDVGSNLAAFNASFEMAGNAGVEHWQPLQSDVSATKFVLPVAHGRKGSQLLSRLEQGFEPSTHEILYLGMARLVDYQDDAYAEQYLDHMKMIFEQDDGSNHYRLTNETGRWLALLMSYEDIPRVAQLKTRRSRLDGLRREVKAAPGQLLTVTEFFRPRIEEISALMPACMGRWVADSVVCRWFLRPFCRGWQLQSSHIGVFLLLYTMAGLRRFRRGMFGYQQVHAQIEHWLTSIQEVGSVNLQLACEVAECGRLVKGYGETRQRTGAQLTEILGRIRQHSDIQPDQVVAWREAALKDDSGDALADLMAAR